ncbi:hypothetical protein GR160_13915 [Flavobacterium sp. Sd200]|uniref:hypothetical protein n=1 Tax=Flavobacterium sp. Sd200 TaxID=2692211 RepID=UPI00136D6629|nr:hypothetical protein [Flavobacterium sp. Sd200]MXN92320.1 hypothetical protein [Flavobacterium sp. Sd200]
MEQVVILHTGGTPVKLNNKFTGLIFDVDGWLNEFKYNNVSYKFYSHESFRRADQNRKGLSNYFNVSKYLLYIQYIGNEIPTAYDLVNLETFDFKPFIASVGDNVSVNIVNFEYPYNYYYKNKKYSFNVEIDPVTNNVRRYIDLETQKLNFPANATAVDNYINLNIGPTGYFFKKNGGDQIEIWQIDDFKKATFCRILTLSAFVISYINKDIFSKIIDSTTELVLDAAANSSTPDIIGLTDIEIMIFLLKKSWGYYYIPGSNLPHREDFDAVLSNTPNEEEYLTYLNSLDNFYNQAYVLQDLLAAQPAEKKFKPLMALLPVPALILVPLRLRIEVLKDLMKNPINQQIELFVLRIIHSISNDDANIFLDFLLKKEDGLTTVFQVLYEKMDDERLTRLPFLSLVVYELPNRMHFVTALFNLWKVSKYNFYRPDGFINQQCYFFTDEGRPYVKYSNGKLKEIILEYGQSELDIFPESDIPTLKLFVATSVNYKCLKALEGIFVTIEKDVNYIRYYETQGGGHITGTSVPSKKTETQYHLYQPLTITGHKTQGVVIPNETSIPAFLFYYTQDYEKLKQIDAAISLAIEIGIEAIAFFYLTGGLTTLKHLGHLRELLNIQAAIEGGIAANETVLIWTGLEAGTEVFSVTASVISSLSNYNATILPEGPERDQQIEVSKTFMWLSIISAGGAALFRYKAVKSAEQVLNSIADGINTNIPSNVLEVLTHLKGQKTVALAQFQGSLASYNNITAKLNSYTDELKAAFWTDFNSVQDSTFWNRLNSNQQYIDNWRDLYLMGAPERMSINFVSDTPLVNGMVTYYQVSGLKEILIPLAYNEKVNFFRKYSQLDNTTFQKITNQPNRLELIIEYERGFKTGPDKFDDNDIMDIIASDLEESHINLLRIKNTTILREALQEYIDRINNQTIPVDRIIQIHDGEPFTFFSTPPNPNRRAARIKRTNTLLVEIQKYSDGIPSGDIIKENYLSGDQISIQKILNEVPQSQLDSSFFRDITNHDEFNIFKRKAFDLGDKNPGGISRSRVDDSEVKFIYNFLNDHWNTADRFDIVFESKLYTCQSCQGYYTYLLKMGDEFGKTLNITVKSNPKIGTASDIIIN